MWKEPLNKQPLIIPGDTERIEDNSFTFKSYSEIIIEEGVKEIGGWAFAWTDAETVSIPSSVVKIEENPFPHSHISNVICNSPNYHIQDGALVENDTFRMVSYVGPERNSSISIFELDSVYDDTMDECEYTIPSYIKILGEGCFRGRRLDKIIIPPTVETILQNPFVECSAEIINYSPNYILDNGFLIERASKTSIAYVGNEKDIVVPEDIEIIEGCAFELLDYGVDSITLPESIIEIRNHFGRECSLQHIFVHNGCVDTIQKLLPEYHNIISEKASMANENMDLLSYEASDEMTQ